MISIDSTHLVNLYYPIRRMQRSRREIKTPKRFDDEPFETPRSRQQSATKSAPNVKQELVTDQQEEPSVTIKTPTTISNTSNNVIQTPTKQTSIKSPFETKSIIKVKLTRAKPLVPIPHLDISIPSIASSPSAPPTPTSQPITPKPAQQVKQTSANKQSLSPKQSVPTKQLTTPRQPHSNKYSTSASKYTPKIPSAQKISNITKPSKSTPVVRQPDPDLVSVPRPKKERPRTPPAYPDVIPNVVLPFWDARTAAEDHEDDNVKELVHCHCGIPEELGLMVQCETCLTWQHANCLGIEAAEDVPDGYTCGACSDPKFVRESRRWDYDQDWILKGRMKQFACDTEPISEENVRVLQKINQLISDTLKLHQLIHSLRVKSRILANANDDDPELKLFKVQWPASYQHRDGSHFIPTINHSSDTPPSNVSVISETPDPGFLPVDTVVDVALPDIGQLGDVSALLDNTDLGTGPIQALETNHEATPNDCRSNLRLHIQQTEEFISIEMSQLQEQLTALEKECQLDGNGNKTKTSFETLKNDLRVMRDLLKL